LDHVPRKPINTYHARTQFADFYTKGAIEKVHEIYALDFEAFRYAHRTLR